MRDCIDEGTLQAWFDGELSSETAANVTSHVNTCAHCAEAARTLKAENSLMATAIAAEFSQSVPTERLRQRLDARIAALNSGTSPKNSAPRWTLSSWFAFRPLAYASVAAVVLLAAFLGFVYLKKENANPPVKEARNQNLPELPQPSPQPPIVPDGNKPEPPILSGDNKPNPPSSPQTPRRMKRNPPAPRTNEPSFVKQEREYQTTIARLNETFHSKPPLRPSLRVEYEYNLALIDNAITATRDVARKNPKDPHAAQFVLSAYQSKVDLMNQFDELRSLER
jgi:negative regulator of sigma E activity